MRSPFVLVLSLVLLAPACGGDDGTVDWRGLELEVPAGWQVNERDASKLSLATAPFDQESVDDLEAAAFLTHEPGTQPDDWRRFVEEQDGEVESDDRLTVDGAPATRLVFSYDANGTPMREMVVLVPSRQVVMLFQPIVPRGSDLGPGRFAEHRPTFDAIVASVTFGAPVAAGSQRLTGS